MLIVFVIILFSAIVDATSIVCDKQSVCLGATVTCTCTIEKSNTLAWSNNGNRLMFTSTDPLETRRDVTGSSTFAVLTNNSDTNGIRVITSSFTFIASMTNILTCENVDHSTSRSVIIPISGKIKCLYLSDHELHDVMLFCRVLYYDNHRKLCYS